MRVTIRNKSSHERGSLSELVRIARDFALHIQPDLDSRLTIEFRDDRRNFRLNGSTLECRVPDQSTAVHAARAIAYYLINVGSRPTGWSMFPQMSISRAALVPTSFPKQPSEPPEFPEDREIRKLDNLPNRVTALEAKLRIAQRSVASIETRLAKARRKLERSAASREKLVLRRDSKRAAWVLSRGGQ